MALLRRELLAERGAHHTPEPSPGSPAPSPLALGPRSLRTLCVRGYGDAQSCQVCPCVSLIFQGRPAAPSTRTCSLPDLPCPAGVLTSHPRRGRESGYLGSPSLRASRQRHRSPLGFPVPRPHELLGSGILKFSVSSARRLAPRRYLEVFLFGDRAVEPEGARLKPRDTGSPPTGPRRCWAGSVFLGAGEVRTASRPRHDLLTGQGDRFATRWRLGRVTPTPRSQAEAHGLDRHVCWPEPRRQGSNRQCGSQRGGLFPGNLSSIPGAGGEERGRGPGREREETRLEGRGVTHQGRAASQPAGDRGQGSAVGRGLTCFTTGVSAGSGVLF